MQVVLGLGTNLGDREANLARALDALERLEGTQIVKLSNLYETEPFDVISQQEDYLNCCVLLETSLKPQRLLEHCLEIEQSLGRVRLEYHGARTMDIDILLCEGFSSDTPPADRAPSPHPGAGLCAGAPVGLVPPAQRLWLCVPRGLRGGGQVRGGPV